MTDKILDYTITPISSADRLNDFYTELINMLDDFLSTHLTSEDLKNFRHVALVKGLINQDRDHINPNIIMAARILDPMLDYSFLTLRDNKLIFKQPINYIGKKYDFTDLESLISYLKTEEVLITTSSNYDKKTTFKQWKNISKFLKGTFATVLPYQASSKQAIHKRFDYKNVEIETELATTNANTPDIYFSDFVKAGAITKTQKMDIYTVSTELSTELAHAVIHVINKLYFDVEHSFYDLPSDMQTIVLHLLVPTYRQIMLVDDHENMPTFFRLNAKETTILVNALLEATYDNTPSGLENAIDKFEVDLSSVPVVTLAESHVNPAQLGNYLITKSDTNLVVPDFAIKDQSKTPAAVTDTLKEYGLDKGVNPDHIPSKLLVKLAKPVLYLLESYNLAPDLILNTYKSDETKDFSKLLQIFNVRNDTLPIAQNQ